MAAPATETLHLGILNLQRREVCTAEHGSYRFSSHMYKSVTAHMGCYEHSTLHAANTIHM